MTDAETPYSFSHPGFCPACEQDTIFKAERRDFRGWLKCEKCKSIPRHRALMHALSLYYPNWKKLAVHESSPGWDIVSQRLEADCEHYMATHYDVEVDFGSMVVAPMNMPCKQYRSENLEAQTFSNEVFDLVISQDVFEHIQRPDLAIKEIARTLKPGGATIMTVPIVNRVRPSARRSGLVQGKAVHFLEPQYHGNPINKSGSLVTVDWGYDIVSYLQHHSGLSFIMMQIDNIDLGIRAAFNEVLVGLKRPFLSI